MDIYREETLEHMGYLWTAWRSTLYLTYVRPCKTKGEALKNCPPFINVGDWTWLVNEKFSTEEFQRMSKRNMKNRAKTVMPHRSGSKPHRAIIYDMDEIVKTTQFDPSLSTMEVIDKCFGPQSHNRVFGYGGGIKRKQLSGPKSTYEKELEAKIQARDAKIQDNEEENRNLKRRLEAIESRLDMGNGCVQSSPVASPSTNSDHHEGILK
ncbi:uncharacterized protein [Euphorbia lathyris]|uniref:uncharacterized protein n=1 Tax=Euphorbia lathyris TaxID=212925 RepID=UPI0033140E63